MTEPTPPAATLHDRIEQDRSRPPAHSQGGGTTRLAALVAAARERLPTRD